MSQGGWLRFRPKLSSSLGAPSDVFARADAILKQTAAEQFYRDQKLTRRKLDRIIKVLKKRRDENRFPSKPELLLAILLAEGPRAATAQMEMDAHLGGYNNHKARLYELIEFNDCFVDTVLALPSYELSTFTSRLRIALHNISSDAHSMSFTDEQFTAISHGLSREIAVFRGARAEGLEARMTTRSEDARGVDMVIRDPKSGRRMNIDCKTHSSYHFRLLDIKRDRLITEEERLEAELRGFAVLKKGKHADFVQTTLVRIATEYLGEIHDFSFDSTEKIGTLLRQALAAQ